MSTVKKINCLDIDYVQHILRNYLNHSGIRRFVRNSSFFHSTFYQEHEFFYSTFCQEHEFFHGPTLTLQNEHHVAYFFMNHLVNCQNSFDEDELTKLN